MICPKPRGVFIAITSLLLTLSFWADSQFACAKERSLDTVDVYLVPLDDFPEEMAVAIAKTMSADMHLWIKSSLQLGDLNIDKLPGTNQLISEDILRKSQQSIRNLPEKSDHTYFLLLTGQDINSQSGGFRFQFSTHDRQLNTSVVSLARMLKFVDGRPVMDAQVQTRFYKMIKRAVGEMHLGWKRSTDITDIMYAPIMGVDDLDRIGSQHNETPPKAEPAQTEEKVLKSI